MLRFARVIIATSIVITTFASFSPAQPLADRVPEDAILYVGWRGISDPGPGYDESHLKALLEASQVKALTNNLMPRIARRVAMQDEQAAEAIRRVWEVAEPLWKYPTALYFGGVDATNPEATDLKITLLCDAGEQSQALLDSLTRAIAEAPPQSNVRLSASMVEDVVVFSTYPVTGLPEAPLARDAQFVKCREKTASDAVVTLYLDNEKLLDFVDLSINASGGDDAKTYWPKVRQALRLDAVKRMAWTSGFDGAEWSDVLWVDAPGPREGLLAALEGSPISEDSLRVVPKDATLMNVTQFDFGAFVNEIRRAVNEIDPQVAEQFEKGMSAISLMAGANVEAELIQQLGSQWTTYASPSVGGRSSLGMVLLNQPKDSARVEKTLGLIEIAINNTIAGQLQKQSTPMKVRFERAKLDELNLHYWALPLITPAWAMKDGTMYAGFFPQTVVAAASGRVGGDDESILDNDKFQNLRKRLGGDGFHTFQYVDLPEVAPEGYSTLLMLSRIPLGMSDILGVTTPPLVVPTFDQFRPHLAPMGSATRVDEEGFLFKSLSPFPGAGIFALDSGSLFGGSPLQLLGALGPAIEGAQKSAREARMRQQQMQQGEMGGGFDEDVDVEATTNPGRPLRPRPGPRE